MISDKVCTQGSELIDVDRLVPEMIRNFELLSPYILIFFFIIQFNAHILTMLRMSKKKGVSDSVSLGKRS